MRRLLIALAGAGWTPAPALLAQAPPDSAGGAALSPRPGDTVTVIAGARYRASGLHRFFFGDHYRALWATPIAVPVLDLRTYAGGLQPVRRGGGKQTKSLRLVSSDGRKFAFRSLDKDPSPLLPPELRATLVDRILRDQISAAHPLGAVVVPPLLDAVGVVHAAPQLFVLPDDPALGEFRAEFGGMLGLLEERPSEADDDRPGFAGARKTADTDELLERLDRDSREQVDARAFLAARLMDLFLGDWDRHADQWKWIKLEDEKRAPWLPVPYDRDQAFVRFDGLLLALARQSYPQLVNFGGDYPRMLGLTWNGRDLDRRLLTGLEWTAWDSVAQALQARLTDAVIDTAVGRLPVEYQAVDGARLARSLRLRRDHLGDAALRFYRLLAGAVNVTASNDPEVAVAEREPGGILQLAVSRRRNDGTVAAPFYRRRFAASETKEVRLFLRGGGDSVAVKGSGGGPLLRVIAPEGTAVSGGGASRLKRYHDTDPDQPDSLPGAEQAPRDWGSLWRFNPVLAHTPDIGFVFGMAPSVSRYGFRKHPYAARYEFRAAYATSAGDFRIDFRGDWRREMSRTHVLLDAHYSGIEVVRFFGFGNETLRTQPDEFFRVRQEQFVVAPSLGWSAAGRLRMSAGPVLKHATTDLDTPSLISLTRPYGSDDFTQLGARAGLEYDTRDVAANPRRGVHFAAGGSVYPGIFDVTSTFGEVHGEAATFLHASMPLEPVLALRAGAKRVWGTYPFHEAAAVGGASTVRGLRSDRYLGDAAVFANAELRLRLTRFDVVLPGEMGVFGLGDAGRVWLEGESSDTWHTGVGGGLWFAFLSRASTMTLAIARGDDRTAFYLRAGFGF